MSAWAGATLVLTGCATAPLPHLTRYGDASTVYATGVQIAPGAPLYMTAGLTAGDDPAPTMKGQALQTLKRVADNLAAAGLGTADIAFVRAYLAPGPDGTVDYAGWTAAWNETFGTAALPAKPARTTVAVPSLGRPTTLIEIEAVSAGPPGSAPFASAAAAGLPAVNPVLKPYGNKDARIAAGVGVMPGAGLYWTAGTLAAMAKPDAPADSPERYGDMATQARSTLQRLQQNLANVGLSFQDVVFLRAFVGPDALGDGSYGIAAWNTVYDAFFHTADNPHKPARTTVTTPTYGGGPLLEVELVTAFPGALPASVAFDGGNPGTVSPQLKAYGTPSAPIASGMAVKPGSGLYFSAGAVPSAGGDLKTQALSALDVLQRRLAEAGLGFKDVIFLRAYVVPEADGSIDRQGWNAAYTAFFNNPAQPHKPARTTIAVQSLPKPEWKIEIDVVAAHP